MRSKRRILFLGVSILWIAANVAWLGCAILPLPPSRKPIDSRKKADFKALKENQPTREEVVAKFGPPDAYLDDLHVACYRINSVTHRETLLLFFVIPTPVNKTYDFDLALIQFDKTDHVKRSGVASQGPYEEYRRAAERWLASFDKPAAKP